MSWSLQITLPQSKYKAGDTVSGKVCLISQDTKDVFVNVGSITIGFTGRSTTAKSWPRIPNSIQLFSYNSTLFTGPKRLHAPYSHEEDIDSNAWSFSFILPPDCSASRRDSSPSSSSNFNYDPTQPLPISFVDDDVQGGSCSVVYELQATLVSPLKDGYYTNKGCTKKVEVSVYRPRRIQQPTSAFNTKNVTFTHRSLLLLPREERETAHRPLTIKEKLKLRPPSTEHLPKAVFKGKVQTPSAAVIGQPVPLMLHIDYDLAASTVPPPIFHLKRVVILLCKETSISSVNRNGEHESPRHAKEFTLQVKEFETRRPRVEEHLDLRTVMDTAIDPNFPPTFKTFNIGRTYSLKVYISLLCASKEHLIFGDYKRCTLYAAEYDAQRAVYNEPAPVMNEEEMDPPPPYHFVAQEAVPEYSAQAHHAEHPGYSQVAQDGAGSLNVAEPSFSAGSNAGVVAPSAAAT